MQRSAPKPFPLPPRASRRRTLMIEQKIKAHHVERRALLYVRQSSAHQVLHNEESRRLQYAMEARARSLGWKDVEVIDEDLGRSATSAVGRTGFQYLVA